MNSTARSVLIEAATDPYAIKVSCPTDKTIPLSLVCSGGRPVGRDRVKAKETVMRAKWGLSTGVALISLTLVGTGQAWSQMVSLTLCNDSSVLATVVVVGGPSPSDNRLFMWGWYNANSGDCVRPANVAPGAFYVYAHGPYNVEWPGTDQRFCVDEPGPINRLVSQRPSCAINLSKWFKQFQAAAGQYLWRLPPPTRAQSP